MRRILSVLTVALVMVAMVAVMAAPVFADGGSNPQGLGKDIANDNCGKNTQGDFYTYDRGNNVDSVGVSRVDHCLK